MGFNINRERNSLRGRSLHACCVLGEVQSFGELFTTRYFPPILSSTFLTSFILLLRSSLDALTVLINILNTTFEISWLTFRRRRSRTRAWNSIQEAKLLPPIGSQDSRSGHWIRYGSVAIYRNYQTHERRAQPFHIRVLHAHQTQHFLIGGLV